MGSFLWAEISWSGRRDLNPRHPRWQRGTLPLSYSRERSEQSRLTRR